MRCTFQTISDMTELVTKQVQTTLHYQQHQYTVYCNQIVCHKKHVVQLCHYQDPTSTYPQHIMPHWRHCSKAGFRSVWTVLSNTAQLIRGPTEQWKEKGSNKEDVGAIFLFKRAPTFVNPALITARPQLLLVKKNKIFTFNTAAGVTFTVAVVVTDSSLATAATLQ